MKKNYCIYWITLAIIFCSGKTFGQEWEKVFGTPEHDFVEDLTETANGDYLLTGRQMRDHLSVFQFSENGNTIWEFPGTADPLLNSGGHAIINTSDGGFAIAGVQTDPSQVVEFVILLKLDAGGSVQWMHSYTFDDEANAAESNFGYDLLQSPDGGYVIAGTHLSNGQQLAGLLKTDSQGNLEWKSTYGTGNLEYSAIQILPLPDGGYAIPGNYESSESCGFFLLRVDPSGNEIDLVTHSSTSPIVGMVLTDDAGFIAANANSLLKLDSQGIISWSLPVFIGDQEDGIAAIVKTAGGNITLAGPEMGSVRVHLLHFDQQGILLWNYQVESIHGGIQWISSLITTSDGGYLVGGQRIVPGELSTLKFQYWIMKIDALEFGNIGFVNGSVYVDSDDDCHFDSEEQALGGQLIQAIGQDTFYSTSIASGQYSLPVAPGDYTVNVIPMGSPYWVTCPDEASVSIAGAGDIITRNLGLQAEVECPLLEVDLGTHNLRRCFESEYYVNYCNLGTQDATDAYIEVLLDPFLEYVSASIPLASQDGNLLTFDLGTVEIGQCGSFTITVLVSCDAEMGQTHCTEAHIFPDEICFDDLWNGPVIEVEGECEGDIVRFRIVNQGSSMTQEHQYIVTEDNIILMQAPFQLDAGEERIIDIPIENSSTYRLEAEQAPGFPRLLGSHRASVSVEGCNGVNPGFVTIYPQDEASPFVSIDCQENGGAFDPNDKQGFPKGRGEEHFIEPNTDIDYYIRFQNTGTDTAFTVVIRDTLDKNLDIASIRPGASSHPYEFEVFGRCITQITFKDIMLPDSNVNQEASRGFIKFTVSQKPDLKNGTVLNNTAAIFFDFNEPVITNRVWHTIGENTVTAIDITQAVGPDAETIIAPNPFSGEANVEIKGIELSSGIIRLYNLQGQLLRQQGFHGNQFRLGAQALPKGLYLFRIESEGNLIGSGKLIVQ